MRINELNQNYFLHKFTFFIFTHELHKIFKIDFLWVEALFQDGSNINSCFYTTKIF